ncbi:cytochrome b/b6 domain-containing protein [Microbacterium luteolum]|uniref:Cytochrome b/b6 domain-containing protein n=1 Tax=Microbacterium luteolum TaxID=69367 RepID=A0ABY7XJ14_MICLT|nr:cytochrome b/b6 domain-containing protein [Microbacterium luteolum]
MATRMLRRGLPRVPGGEPWPPADAAGVVAEPVEASSVVGPSTSSGTQVASSAEATPGWVAEPVEASSAVGPSSSSGTQVAETQVAEGPVARMRRGLPRVVGGEPWPPAATAAVGPASDRGSASAEGADTPDVGHSSPSGPTSGVSTPAVAPAAPEAVTTPVAAAAAVAPASGESSVRRGLPRVAGGEPWPPAGTAPVLSASASPATGAETPADGAPEQTGAAVVQAEAAAPVAILSADLDTPLPWTRTVWNGRAPRHVAAAPASARRLPSWPQAIAGLLGAAALGLVAGAAIAFVRTLLSFPFMQDFLAAFPGEYEPAIAVAPGFAPWIGWQHFFNMFLIVLIIRSGLRVRSEKRPTVFWTPRGSQKGKISLTLWFHQALDLLWIINGVIFVVLIFVTGHWVRIVPTSWEVFPNALSAALQYVSFDWPHENGWNNYNSLQQLAYFTTVFVAAPLAVATGFRMSGLWPKKAEKLSKAYPVEWARALHFPIMLYFVAFIIAHVALVMLTGFLRNLNHMYAAQDAVTWTGFWVFLASLAVLAVGWFSARPLVLAPIAKLFGQVSGR